MLISKITKFLDSFDLISLAKETGFIKRSDAKITPYEFILSFFLASSAKKFSFRKWSLELSSLLRSNISSQAIDQKITYRHIGFVKKLLDQAMSQCDGFKSFKELEILKPFSRVLIEDSTCVKLSHSLYNFFSGVRNATSQVTNCRIQICLDIKTSKFENLELTTYSKNDGSFSSNVLDRIRSGDLIIRDLGYWKREVFAQIAAKNCYFISKLKANSKLLEVNENKDFTLVQRLKELDKSKIENFDFQCRLAGKTKLSVRIVGVKMSDDQIDKRRQNAIASRHNGSKISENAEYLFSWNIYITNVTSEQMTIQNIAEIYRLRWHIEMVIKNWKSNFNLSGLLASCTGKNPAKVEMKLYLSFLYVITIYQSNFNQVSDLVYSKSKRIVSALKFGQYINDNLKLLVFYESENLINDLIRYCCYEKRRDRNHYYQYRYTLEDIHI